MIIVKCPQCGKQSQVNESAIGKRARCSKCSQQFVITAPAPASVSESKGGLEELADDYGLAPLEPPQPISRPESQPQTLARPAAGLSPQLHATASSVPASKPFQPSPASSPASKLPLILILSGSGLLLVCVVLGGIVWALTRPDAAGPGAAAAAGGPGAGAAANEPQDGGISSKFARHPKTEAQSWLPAHPLAFADPTTWKVTAEPERPAVGKLHSEFRLQDLYHVTHHFSAPEVAQAATIRNVEDPEQPAGKGWLRLAWTRLDLKSGERLGELLTSSHLGGEGWRYSAALSPNGKHLALAFPYLPGKLEIWSDDGEKEATIELADVTAEATPRRVHFLTDSRVLVDIAGNLIAYDLPDGSEAFRIPAGFVSRPVLSPGRKWLAGYAGDGIAWYSAADGTPAGKIALGEHWHVTTEPDWQERLDWGLAFHPSGKSVAVLAMGKNNYQTLVAHYDLASGRTLEQFVLPAIEYEQLLAASWCGDRQLQLITGHIVDLDLKTFLGCQGDRTKLRHHFTTQPPDGRCWRLVWHNLADKLEPDLGLPEDVHVALVATTVPDAELVRRKAEAKTALLWGPDFTVAVDTDEVLKEDRRPKVLGALADTLAERGYQVDPSANFRMMVKEARALSLPNPQKPGTEAYVGELKLELVDRDGKTVARYRTLGVNGEGDYEDCWNALCEQIRKMEPLPMVWRAPDGTLTDPTTERRPLGVDR